MLRLLHKFLQLTVELIKPPQKIKGVILRTIVHTHIPKALHRFPLVNLRLNQLPQIHRLFHPVLILRCVLLRHWVALEEALHLVESLVQLFGVEVVDVGRRG